MNVNLSWDLFILVFFAVVVAYSFIIGRNQTSKVIAATYIGILCADGLGNFFGKYFANSTNFVHFMKYFAIGGSGDQLTAFFKVLILIVFVVVTAIRGSFNFDLEGNQPMGIRMVILMLLGILSAGLMISAMLIFVDGNSLIMPVANHGTVLSTIYQQSRMVRIMIDYANLWFVLPGVGLMLASVFGKKAA